MTLGLPELYLLCAAVGVPLLFYWVVYRTSQNSVLPPGSNAPSLRESELKALIEEAVAKGNAPLHAQIGALQEKVRVLERQLPPKRDDELSPSG